MTSSITSMNWQLLQNKGYLMPLDPAVLEFILMHEGGLVDNPVDPGGLTHWGISLRAYPWLRRDGLSALLPAQAGCIYRRDYWDALRASEMPSRIACAAFDCGVNQGLSFAAKTIQRAAGVLTDGDIGPKTLAALRVDPDRTLTEFMALRAKRYAENKNFKVFGLGWMRRLMHVYKYSLDQEGV